MQWLKQSTAATVKLGPFVDETDGKTAETALTISQADIRLSKNGGAFAQTNNAAGATHDENGWYGVPLNTTDTGTLGRLVVAVHESGALPVWREFMVVPANMYDSLVAGSDYLQTDAHQVEGSDATDQINAACDMALSDYDGPTNTEMEARTLVAASYFDSGADTVTLADGGLTAAKIAADAIGSSELAASAATEIAEAIRDTVMEDALTLRHVLRILLSKVSGEANGGGTTTINYRDQADTKNRITLTVDANGNRSATVIDGS